MAADAEVGAQELEGLLLGRPAGFEAFVAFCRGYFCQDHAAFVGEAWALQQAFHTLVESDRMTLRERLVALVDRYVVVGSECDLGLTYYVTLPLVHKSAKLRRRKNVFRDECEEFNGLIQALRENLQDKLAATIFLNFMASPEWPQWQANCIRVAPRPV
jgi:hypothetical protein